LNPLSAVYGGVARLRRSWYASHPQAVRRLDRPVISVGNLVVGGSGKTPVVAYIARLLRQHGHVPSILTRGYGRRRVHDGVVVVSDGQRVRAGLDESGDEPLMLAKQLTGVPVLVSPDRYLAGRLAERHFACTVHLLDDGFQHLHLARETNLLIVEPSDLDAEVLPAGPLREPIDAGRMADAVLVAGSSDEAARVGSRLGLSMAFRLTRRYGVVTPLDGRAAIAAPGSGMRIVALAAVARPERFFSALRAQGWMVVREMAFHDHHHFTARDLEAVHRAVQDTRADLVVTTWKDAVRIGPHAGWAALDMEVEIDPTPAFADWLLKRIAPPVQGPRPS
jgi:tetraacyldisaccharide 4'-kinase